MKKILTLVLAAVMALSLFAGCNGANKALGKYTLESIEMNGQDMTALFSAFGFDTDAMYIELMKDGKFKMVYEDELEGTWKLDGKKLTLTAPKIDEDGNPGEEKTLEGTLDGKTITITEEEDGQSASITFKKSK